MVNDIDIFKILEENRFSIKEIIEKYIKEKEFSEQLIEKNRILEEKLNESKEPTEPDKKSRS